MEISSVAGINKARKLNMPYSSKFRLAVLIIMSLLPSASCTYIRSPFGRKTAVANATQDAPTDPAKNNPEWAYDAPGYMKPAAELEPEAKSKVNDPLHYFTRERVVSIRRPGNYTPEETPRVAIFWTDNNGFQWNKAGYFGREQSFFPLNVEQDGDYGIRFVGPGQEPAKDAPAMPERVYHVDTIPPEVEVGIQPEQTWYTPGQSITINWRAKDYHLIERPVSVFVLVDYSASNPRPTELRRDMPDEGTITYEIPGDMLDHELRIRVEALDRASNLGDGISYALQIVSDIPYDDSRGDEIASAREKSTTETDPFPGESKLTAVAMAKKSAPVYSVRTGATANTYMPSILQEELIEDEKPEADSSDDVEPTPVAKVAVNSSMNATATPKLQPLTKKMSDAEEEEADEDEDTDTSESKLATLTKSTMSDDETEEQSPSTSEISSESSTASPSSSEPPISQSLDPMPATYGSISYSYNSSMTRDFSNDSIVESIVRIPSSDSDDEPAVATESSDVVSEEPGEGSALDPLVMPLPATLSTIEIDSRWNIAHPWRLLGNIVASSKAIWVLPPMSADKLERIGEESDSDAVQSRATIDEDEAEAVVGVPDEIPEPPVSHE